MSNTSPIPIYIGYDHRERAATNVLIDSLYQRSSKTISITPLITSQLREAGLYTRERDPKQSTDFSFTRFLVPYLQNYQGWAIFMDCDMLCRRDIDELWKQRDDQFALMCVKHEHIPSEKTKFLGEIQSAYPKKNWSSLMLMNCEKCKNLTLNNVNNASGLELHRFIWLGDDNLIGSIQGGWNFLIGEQELNLDDHNSTNPPLVHWTLGGPWFNEQRNLKSSLNKEWFDYRNEIIKLWD